MGPVVTGDAKDTALEELEEAVNCADALSRILGRAGRSESVRPFDLFQQLHRWRAEGWLLEMEMIVQKRNPDDLLRYEWLSDGERVFLGRTALFQLLAGQDDALFLLDEPETHFNDIWKREIVDIIDDSLRGDASEVILATHSSIALTDVFDEEIELLRKKDGRTVVGRITTPHIWHGPQRNYDSGLRRDRQHWQARPGIPGQIARTGVASRAARGTGTTDPEYRPRLSPLRIAHDTEKARCYTRLDSRTVSRRCVGSSICNGGFSLPSVIRTPAQRTSLSIG